MYTQTQLPGHIRGGYQLGTGGVLGAPYGQNPEVCRLHRPIHLDAKCAVQHPSLRQISAPAQGFFVPSNPTYAYPSSTHSTQTSSMLPAAGEHQRHAPVGALNHTGTFGTNFNVGASNIHHDHTAGHSTSTLINGRGVIPNLEPLQTSSHAVMVPSQAPTPAMTAGTSRSSSYTPETPGNDNVPVPPTVEEFKKVFYEAMLPQLPDADLDYVRLRHDRGEIHSLRTLGNHTNEIQLHRRLHAARGDLSLGRCQKGERGLPICAPRRACAADAAHPRTRFVHQRGVALAHK
ncbi:hypothetical protein PENSPDRAFT_50014 [Peniophora sp. CONT]|nr:hypothetical protein PENSPDRAFT_50014 [Peniophora sp. CONT]